MNLSSIIAKLGISSSLAQDLTLLVVIILISVFFAIFIGRTRLVSVLLSAYISVALLSVAPAGFLVDYTYELLAFLILVVMLTIFGKGIFETSVSGMGSRFMWRSFALSFLEVVMLISVVVSIIPKKVALGYVSASSYGYLVAGAMSFVWMAAPLVFLLFIQRRTR